MTAAKAIKQECFVNTLQADYIKTEIEGDRREIVWPGWKNKEWWSIILSQPALANVYCCYTWIWIEMQQSLLYAAKQAYINNFS